MVVDLELVATRSFLLFLLLFDGGRCGGPLREASGSGRMVEVGVGVVSSVNEIPNSIAVR
jgi:hypothetical protein